MYNKQYTRQKTVCYPEIKLKKPKEQKSAFVDFERVNKGIDCEALQEFYIEKEWESCYR